MAVPLGGLDHDTAQSIAWKKLWKVEPRVAERIFDGSDGDTSSENEGWEEEEEEEADEVGSERPHTEEEVEEVEEEKKEEEAIPPKELKTRQADAKNYDAIVGSYYDIISQYGQRGSTSTATGSPDEGVPPKSTSSMVWSGNSQDNQARPSI